MSACADDAAHLFHQCGGVAGGTQLEVGAVAHQGQEHGGHDISPQPGVFGIGGNADDEIAGLRARCRLILLRIAHMLAHGILIGEVLSGKRLIDKNRHGSRLRLEFWRLSRHCAGLPDGAAFRTPRSSQRSSPLPKQSRRA